MNLTDKYIEKDLLVQRIRDKSLMNKANLYKKSKENEIQNALSTIHAYNLYQSLDFNSRKDIYISLSFIKKDRMVPNKKTDEWIKCLDNDLIELKEGGKNYTLSYAGLMFMTFIESHKKN